MLKIIDHGHEFHVMWDMNHFHKRNLEAVKAIDPIHDRRFINDPKTGKKYWWVAGSQRQTITSWQTTHQAIITKFEAMKPEEIGELPPMAELTIDLPLKPGTVLRPYQKQGIAQAMKFGRCLIGDEPGLGKTIQSIGTVLGWDAFPCLVVCPTSLKQNWKREWEKFSHKRAMVLDAAMTAHQKKNWFSYVAHGMVDVVIMNYESLNTFCIESYPQKKTKTGKKKPWKAADAILRSFMNQFKSGILDESHRCKDPLTNQAKFILKIFSGIEHRLLLSGTPVVNKPVDLFPQLAILGTLHHFGNRDGFMKRYCDGGTGANNLKELNYKMNLHCFFRREKKDVAKDLPDKQRQTILCDITTRAEYTRCVNDFEKYLRDSGSLDDEAIARRMRGEIMTKMMQLKQISAKGKMNEVKEFVNEVLESGEKLVLFCHLHEIVDMCREIWPDAVTVTGRDDMNQRQRNIDRFQNDPSCQLIICNHKAAGVGLTLTASSRVAFIEYPWHYADCVQCEDRCHRIGAKDNVMCTYFLGKDTVDERMWEIILSKMTVANTITGNTDDMNDMEIIESIIKDL